jgi:uncharacterized protein (DUF2252 family)
MKKAVSIDVAERARVLEARRVEKMASSAHAYVRGATADFYAWLAELRDLALPSGPPVWICGDCHVGNLGPLADARGEVEVQIRDLDQTVIGNPAHDLIRLGLSLASAARGSDLPGVTTANMIEEMVVGYAQAMHDLDSDQDGLEAEPESEIVRSVKRRALGRRWRHLAKERLDDVKPAIPLGRKFWALSDDERDALEALFAEPGVSEMVLALNAHEGGRLKLHDAAYWMKGCSSLGKLRYAVLLEIEGGREAGGKIALVDLKEAVASVAPSAPGAELPRHHGQRVVAGARALSPNLGGRMMAADLLGRPIVVRELAPQDLKLEIDQFSSAEAARSARYLARVVGRAHARQMDEATRRTWCRELERRRPTDLEAPNWLWTSVVELAGRHEKAYLEHCRRYALRTAV